MLHKKHKMKGVQMKMISQFNQLSSKEKIQIENVADSLVMSVYFSEVLFFK